MSKWLSALVFVIFIILSGCIQSGMEGDKPPKTMIQIGEISYETKLGTYCWSSNGQGECVDTAGPVELLKGKKPIEVRPGEVVTLKMKYKPLPNKVHLNQVKNEKVIEVPVVNYRFTAPTEKGIYFYSYGVWWMDKKDKNVSNGDAFYAFALEVI